MCMMKRLLLGVSFVALSAGAAMAAPAVVESSVNLRNGPGTEFAVIATLPAGACGQCDRLRRRVVPSLL